MFEVISFKVGRPHSAMYSHGVTRGYPGAANLARIARRAFPDRVVLVLIPKAAK